MNNDTIPFSSNENKMAAITAFWNRRGVVGSQPTDQQSNSSRESADTGKLLTSCYGRLILCIRFWLSEICDLSRDNVPNASRSNAERNGKRTGDERLGKPFETDTVNG